MSAIQEIASDLEVGRSTIADNEINDSAGGVAALVHRFQSLSIGRKITLFFGLNLTLALLAGIAVVFAFVEIDDRAEQLADSHHSAFIAEKIVVGLSQAQRHRENYFTNDDAVRGNAALDEFDRVLVSLEALDEMPGSSSSAYSAQISSLTLAITEHCRELNLALAGKLPIPSAAAREDSDRQVDQTLGNARVLAEAFENQASAATASNRTLITTMLTFWIGVSGILILLTLVAQRYFHRHIGIALSDLANHMTRLSSGEQVAEIEESTRKDEIGDMTRAVTVFHQASLRLERLSRERAQKARAELEEQAALQKQKEEDRLERERTLGQIADKFERKVGDVVDKVASASSQLQSTASSMAASAAQASTRTSEVTSSMQEANSGATEAAAASDEFAMSIGEVSRQAASSAELARKATAATHEADATISKLSDSAGEVGHIVELIQTIAQRTNLLALNASIEAARGGEAGRGFAVVASEVKELAMQTSRATEEVALQIRDMQDTTGASVTALRSIASEVAELESVAVSIASAVDQQSFAGQDLARSIDMAARGTEEVSEHIQEVQELSVSTGSAASQVLSSATALQQEAASLRSQVNGFLDEVRAS